MNDFVEIQLSEPPIVSFSGRDDLSVARYETGDIVIVIGGNSAAPAETLYVPAHLVHALGRALMDAER